MKNLNPAFQEYCKNQNEPLVFESLDDYLDALATWAYSQGYKDGLEENYGSKV